MIGISIFWLLVGIVVGMEFGFALCLWNLNRRLGKDELLPKGKRYGKHQTEETESLLW